MRDTGHLIATDVRPKRVTLLEQTIALSGARCIEVRRVAETGALAFEPPFDRVLVDAPCSGLGTIRRDPDIRWRRRESDLASMAMAQLELLLRAADVVAPSGRLVYATCSSEPDENDAVVAAFLDSHPDFERDTNLAGLPDSMRPLVDESGALRPLPHVHGLEAFFAVRLVRRQ